MSSGQLIPILLALAVSIVAIAPWRHIAASVDLPEVALRPGWAAPTLGVAAVAVIAAARGSSPQVWMAAVVVPLLMWLAWSDLRSKRIPTNGVYAVAVITVVAAAAAEIPTDGLAGWGITLSVGVVASGLLLFAALLTGRAIGAADVRIAFPIGVMVGHWGFAALWATFIFAVLLMFPISVVSLIRRRGADGEHRSSTLPLAPALVAGAVIALVLAP